jgi:hypothetical protein
MYPQAPTVQPFIQKMENWEKIWHKDHKTLTIIILEMEMLLITKDFTQ